MAWMGPGKQEAPCDCNHRSKKAPQALLRGLFYASSVGTRPNSGSKMRIE